jgi:hypothetical protein
MQSSVCDGREREEVGSFAAFAHVVPDAAVTRSALDDVRRMRLMSLFRDRLNVTSSKPNLLDRR